jgi:hypothetical protein
MILVDNLDWGVLCMLLKEEGKSSSNSSSSGSSSGSNSGSISGGRSGSSSDYCGRGCLYHHASSAAPLNFFHAAITSDYK